MTYDRTYNDRARLEMNARLYRHDPDMERVCEMFENDREAWNRLPEHYRNRTDIYMDFRTYHRDAVEAGVIAPDGTVIHQSI